MNHPFFEEWLFADKPLEEEQLRLLQEHLKECGSCYQLSEAWKEARSMLETAPTIAPKAGFTARWQSRWASDQLIRQRKQTIMMLAFYLGGALFMLFILGILLFPFFFMPQPLVLALLYRLTIWFEAGEALVDFTATLLRTVFGALPLTLWIGICIGFASLSIIWIIMLMKLTFTRRVFA